MRTSAHAFLDGIIDYAGLFPPAKLSFPDAVAQFLRHRRDPDGWMLNRFVCPAARLHELAAYRTELAQIGPLHLAVLGRGGDSVLSLLKNISTDIEDIDELYRHFDGVAVVQNYEVNLSAIAGADQAKWFGQLTKSLATVYQSFKIVPYLELSALNHALADALDKQNLSHPGSAGFKSRCGGLEAAAFPAPEQLASVLATCWAAKIPWKATAGLHHPIRHFDAGLQTKMHGFVNVFGAAILLNAGKVAPGQLVDVLRDEDASHFALDEAGFAWMNHRASPKEIRLARQEFATSFGSCSFEEPRDDLRRLGWI